MKLREQTMKFELEADLAHPRRTSEVMFLTEIMPNTVGMAIKELQAIHTADPDAAITINFMSYGGDVMSGLALYDYIVGLRKVGHHITTKAFGYVMSMAAVLLQAGDDRVANPNSFMMIHEISTQLEGPMSASFMEDHTKHTKKYQKALLDILSSRSNITRNTIQKNWKRKDWVMDPYEALKAGFIDRVEEQP